eukprot:1157306-Pelagomonas_calceolata.AAC.7
MGCLSRQCLSIYHHPGTLKRHQFVSSMDIVWCVDLLRSYGHAIGAERYGNAYEGGPQVYATWNEGVSDSNDEKARAQETDGVAGKAGLEKCMGKSKHVKVRCVKMTGTTRPLKKEPFL